MQSKEQLAFAMFQRDYFQLTCLECIMYKKDKHGSYKCTSAENELRCEECFAEWLEEDMEGEDA